MATLTILGRECEVRGLSPLELIQWNSHISRLFAATYWADLYESVKDLPRNLQEVVMMTSQVPAKLDRIQYFRTATQVESVEYLLSMTLLSQGKALEVTEANAPEIFWALQPLILNKPTPLEGGEALARVKEAIDAGLS